MKEYSQSFGYGTNAESVAGKIDIPKLKADHQFMQEQSLGVIASLEDSQLDDELEPTQVTHPVAKNKLEALDWNVKHTMWHCGQLSMVRRAVHERYAFALHRKA